MNNFFLISSLISLPALVVPVQNVSGQSKDYQEARIYLTAESTHQLLHDGGFRAFEPLEQPDENYPTVMIDDDVTFQTIEGFGGAFTDASAITFAKLPDDVRAEFIKACFDPVEGNGYNLCRTTIHSCDYSGEMYTYAEVEGDKKLKHFTIDHDMQYRVPMIRAAMEAAGGNLRFFASPWSPPGWMKTNGEMKHGGKLLPEYQQTWADYFVKYVQEYEKIGIPMWGLTVQNEAMAVQVWESCIFTAEEEKNFVRDYLGPALCRNGMEDIRLMIWDHNRGIIYQRAEAAYEDPEASRYIWGTAFHWYVGDHFENVRMVHDAYPDKNLLYTEAGMGGSWRSAANLARNVIHDLNNWANGWVFWNLILDEENGPRHAGGLHGTNIVNADLSAGEVTYNPPHYVFGHFSRFIKRGAKRIPCTSNNDDLIATAFINPDGSVATVVHNLDGHEMMFQVWIEGKVLKSTIPARGTMTMVL
ncbi:MAG TPA: glucosylceramidase [Bacteroides sp.]|nr:glucosylceramidase [Bacteroides sp.]